MIFTPPAGGDTGEAQTFTYIANNGYADSARSTVTVTVQTPNPYRAFEAENYVAATGATIMAASGASGGKVVSVSNGGATIQYGRFEFGAPGPGPSPSR